MTDFLFDLLAQQRRETDGGRVLDLDPAANLHGFSGPPEKFQEISPSAVATFQVPGLTCGNSSPPEMKGEANVQASELPDDAIVFHKYHPEAECEYSGKNGEAVEISTADGTIQHAVICFAELTKLLRFRHRQGQKHNGQAVTQ